MKYIGLLLFLAIFGVAVNAQDYTVDAPVTHKNLAVYLIRGKDNFNTKNVLTLEEAMNKKLVTVFETSDVNELAIENKSAEFEIFIQSGDIVKGGKQDRVLAYDLILPAKSGKIAIAAFCVESGRWTNRGGENVAAFSSSTQRVVSKDLKVAVNSTKSKGDNQSKVWNEVKKSQDKLSANTNTRVNARESESSLQLALENKKVIATTEEYIKILLPLIENKPDVVGYAFVINGEINSADVYASNDLFKRLWAKMLRATSVEAVAELVEKAKFDEVKAEEIKNFMVAVDDAKPEEKAITKRVKIITRESTVSVLYDARDEMQKAAIHKSYVKKSANVAANEEPAIQNRAEPRRIIPNMQNRVLNNEPPRISNPAPRTRNN